MIRLDPKTNYPMLCLPELRIAVGMIAMTKYQFEQFMFDTHQKLFGASDYELRTKTVERSFNVMAAPTTLTNPRVKPCAVDAENRCGALMTGITRDVLRGLVSWMNSPSVNGIAVPTNDQWRAVHTAMSRRTFAAGELARDVRAARAPRRCIALFNSLDEAGLLEGEGTHVLQLEGGAMEWVLNRDGNYGIMGRPDARLRADRVDATKSPLFGPVGVDCAVGVRWVMPI